MGWMWFRIHLVCYRAAEIFRLPNTAVLWCVCRTHGNNAMGGENGLADKFTAS